MWVVTIMQEALIIVCCLITKAGFHYWTDFLYSYLFSNNKGESVIWIPQNTFFGTKLIRCILKILEHASVQLWWNTEASSVPLVQCPVYCILLPERLIVVKIYICVHLQIRESLRLCFSKSITSKKQMLICVSWLH